MDYDIYQDTDHNRPSCYKAFLNKFRTLQEALSVGDGNFPYETLVVDSMTTLQESMMREIQGTNRTLAKNPTIAEWGMLINNLQDILYKLTSLDCHVVVTAQEQIIQDDLTSEVMVLPLISGKKLPDRLPLWFDEVYHTRVERGTGGVAKYEIMTQSFGS